jgi:hypothetical protein
MLSPAMRIKLPTVLGYGHGDVIRGLEDQWTRARRG